MHKRQRQTLCDMVNVNDFYITSISVFMVKKYSESIHCKKNRRSHNETNVRYIWEIDIGTIRRRFFMETFIFGSWWRSHQTFTQKGLRIFSLCILPWKNDRKSTTKYLLGRQVDVVQKGIRIQSFGHNWWCANGIRVEYLDKIHHIAAPPQSPRVPVENQHRATRSHSTDQLHVDV